jgi:uncharacterized membrane protein
MTADRTRYNLLAGQSRERLAALSDGVFAVAMTLLVLDLKTPAEAVVHSDGELLRALGAIAPRLVIYLMSFMTLGIFWVGQQTQLNELERSDRDLTWVHLAFLAGITLMPFSTSLLAEFISFRSALLLYWLNILLLGAILFWSWRAAMARGLLAERAREISTAVERRIVVAQSLYAAGAALCFVSTYLSLAAIVAVQLIYVIGPRRGLLSRI